MPFIRVDAEMYDEIASELGDELPAEALGARPSGQFEYEAAEAHFKPNKLRPVARVVFEALVSMGATAFGVRYDGGYDEGFSHPETVSFADRTIPAAAAAGQLATPTIVAQVRAAAGKDSMWGNASEVYAKASDQQIVTYALDELAHELASTLLGDGYGTGEYQLYGRLTADFRTGQIVDDEGATKPDDMME